MTFNLKNEAISALDDNGNSKPLSGSYEFSIGGGQPTEKMLLENKNLTTLVKVE